MAEEELSLADQAEDTVVDQSVTPAPEDFDIDSWLTGVRPTRKSVKIYPKAHLVARMEAIADQIDNTPDGENVDELIDEFEQVKLEFHDGVWFTVEKRSSEWVRKYRKELAKRHQLNIDRDADDTPKNPHDNEIVLLYQLAEQIVSPPGVTYNHLRKLADANEGEAAKLLQAMTAANNVLAERAGVMDRDFSLRRSDSTPG